MAKNSKKNKNKANGQAKSKAPETAQPAATEVVEKPESLSVDQPEPVQVPDHEQSTENNNTNEKVSEPTQGGSNGKLLLKQKILPNYCFWKTN